MEEHRGSGQRRESPHPSQPEVLRQEDGAGGTEGIGASNKNVANTKRQRGRGGNAQRQDAKNAGQSPRNPGNTTEGVGPWDVEPEVGRVGDGLPNRIPQLRALGNAIVPQIAKEIGEAIHAAEIEDPKTHGDPQA